MLFDKLLIVNNVFAHYLIIDQITLSSQFFFKRSIYLFSWDSKFTFYVFKQIIL